MAEQYDNNNTFVLFKNDQGDNPKRPTHTGTITVDGKELRLSGWVRESSKGVKFISGTVQEPYNGGGSAPAVEGADAEDDLPF